MDDSHKRDRILVMEDEEEISEIVTAYLEKEGFEVFSADDGLKGIRVFYERRPDLVILDIMMPGLDGWEVTRRIREVSDTPVIVLSARGQESDKVRGLNLGADDYVLKPFGGAELAARVKAALRRARTRSDADDETYSDGALSMNFAQRIVHLGGEPVSLSTKEFNLLAYLVKNAGRVLTHEQIMDRVWGVGAYSYPNIKQYVSYLRQKVEADSRHPRLIETVRDVGYRYNRTV
ncbi:MAG: response regulator transcription factor [Chloroflexi bacterium]|nr:response regulator transcription factor [Chloroflexota bacterium]